MKDEDLRSSLQDAEVRKMLEDADLREALSHDAVRDGLRHAEFAQASYKSSSERRGALSEAEARSDER